MHYSHHDTENYIEKFTVIRERREVSNNSLVVDPHDLVNGRINQANKQYESENTLRMRDIVGLATRLVNIEVVINIDILDVNH